MSRFITCMLCESIFNLTTKEPMVLLCCGETACSQCLAYMTPSGGVGSSLSVFNCKLCKSNQFAGAKVNKQVKMAVAEFQDKNPF